MKRIHSKNSIFLMELLLNVLLFSVLVTIGLQFFIHAHMKTKQTTQLYQAVACCENAANIFQSGDGTLSSLLQTYHYSADLKNRVLIYLDKDFNTCRKKSANYTLTVSLDTGDSESPSKITIVCRTSEGTVLYRLRVSTYIQQTIQTVAKEEFSWQRTS